MSKGKAPLVKYGYKGKYPWPKNTDWAGQSNASGEAYNKLDPALFPGDFRLFAVPKDGPPPPSEGGKTWRKIHTIQPTGSSQTFDVYMIDSGISTGKGQGGTSGGARQSIEDGFGTQSPGATCADCAAQSPPRHIDLKYTYSDGKGVPGATYVIKRRDGSIFKQGRLGADGTARIDGVPADLTSFKYYFHDDPKGYESLKTPRPLSEFGFLPPLPSFIDDALQALQDAGSWIWGVLLGDCNEEPTTSQIIAGTLVTLLPVVDQIGDIRDISCNLWNLGKFYAEGGQDGGQEFDYWLNLTLSAVGCIPEVGTAVKGVFKILYKFAKHLGDKLNLKRVFDFTKNAWNDAVRGNFVRWLEELPGKLDGYAATVISHLRNTLEKLKGALERLAALPGVGDSVSKLLRGVNKISERLSSKVAEVIERFKKWLQSLSEAKHYDEATGTSATKDAKNVNAKSQESQDIHKAGDEEAEKAAKAAAREKRLDELSKDHLDHNGKATAATRKEAEDALALEERGDIPGPIDRPQKNTGHTGDFVDAKGQDWDHKQPHGRDALIDKIKQDAKAAGRPEPNFPPGKPIKGEFNVDKTVQEIQGEILAKENVIMNTEKLSASENALLRQRVKDEGLSDHVKFFPP